MERSSGELRGRVELNILKYNRINKNIFSKGVTCVIG